VQSVSHEEDIENTLKSSQEMEKEEHSVELLKNFSKRDEQEMTADWNLQQRRKK
jgi:hypothetical protein